MQEIALAGLQRSGFFEKTALYGAPPYVIYPFINSLLQNDIQKNNIHPLIFHYLPSCLPKLHGLLVLLHNEKDLFSLIAEGDEDAFAELYRWYVPRLTPFILGITKSEAMVDEMIQETFLRLWMNRDKLREVEYPKAWIFKITANICYTFLKRVLVEKKVTGRILAQSAMEDLATEQNMHAKALMGAIQEAVHGLSPQRRKIYEMSREQQMSLSEICSELGLSLSTVKNTLTTSLQTIREHLVKKGYTISLLSLLLLTVK